MHSRLGKRLHSDGALVTEQFSFRKGISTEDAAFKLTVSVFISINQKINVGGIFCDLVKAFDCVNYELLAKLHFSGIQGISEDLFRSF